ncbi:hypothetical protein FRB99_001683 [Tulasnella sp. 403]|nr:hypothetical protein FRB99_001683 [Tulasnella sp. 403]
MPTIPAGVASMNITDVGVGALGPPPVDPPVLLPSRPALLAESTAELPSPAAFKPTEDPDINPSSSEARPVANQIDQAKGAFIEDNDLRAWVRHSSLDDNEAAPGPSSPLVPLTGVSLQIKTSATSIVLEDSNPASNTASIHRTKTSDTDC